MFGSNGITGYHNVALVKGPAIIVGRKGTCGAVNWSNEDCYPIDTTFYVKLKDNSNNLKFIYISIKDIGLDKMNNSIGVPGLNRNDAYNLKIPLPPLDAQEKIVQAINNIEQNINNLQTNLENLKLQQNQILQKYLF